MSSTYSLIHHKSGDEYLAEDDGAGFWKAVQYDSLEVAREALTAEIADNWIRNQSGTEAGELAEWLCEQYNARDAWVVAELS